MSSWKSTLLWSAIACLGTVALAVLALSRGENVSAIWIVVAALGVYAVAYRFYSRFLARRVLGLDPRRSTPAHRLNDGLDHVPTHRGVLFGHHFAAIAGAGPLIGPVLAAQMGYLPGTLWILAGAVFAGAVQDMVVLFASTRRNGKSLGDMIKAEMGAFPGAIAMVGILAIMIILLAVLGLVVVKALIGSPWGCFTIAATIPLALFMGIYLRYLRPGRVGEVSIIGFVLLLLALYCGQVVANDPQWSNWFTFDGPTLAWILIVYGFIASVIPVWLLLAPRDYLSTFLKIGTIVVLALGILLAAPHLRLPAISRFVDGSGPVFAGSLFPFLFITIACGAVSGFHALVSSGTTPKMIASEADIPLIGFGAMLTESAVAIMALVAAATLEPGVYFALNSPAAIIGKTTVDAAHAISQWGFVITPGTLDQVARQIGEHSILSRTGGAPTLAVGMANILSSLVGGQAAMKYWYHFAILFEALFILTTLDAGTRVGRFMIQDMLGHIYRPLGATQSWVANLLATLLCVAGWGYFLYAGVVDPLGGINTLWPLFGIANQMLAGIALILCSVLLVKMKRQHYLWVTALPAAWVMLTTLWAGWEKLFNPSAKIGFLAIADRYRSAMATGKLLAPAKSLTDMQRIITNNSVDAILCAGFMLLVASLLVCALWSGWRALRNSHPSTQESPPVIHPELAA